MVKFIAIPNALSASNPFLFNVANIAYVSYVGTTSFVIYAGGKSYTFTVASGTAALTAAFVSNINKAILSPAGPVLVTVEVPAGVSIAAAPVVA